VKQYRAQNVYDAAVERLEEVYRGFDRVYLSVSFGKDSTVLLYLALDVARRLGKLPVEIVYIDLEGQYQSTGRLAEACFSRSDVVGHWVCLPINLRNAVSMHQPFWTCWDPDEQERWIRPMPDHPAVVSDEAAFPFFYRHMEFEEFVPEYGAWMAQTGRTCCLVAIRSDESLNRFRTIASHTKDRWRGYAWTTKIQGYDNIYNAYPIYDWRTEDIWTATGRNGWPYNRIYDLMHMAGVSIHEARLCQPYGDDQRRGLDLYHRCEPETWPRVVQRVTGANFGAKYAKSALMGFRKMVKPPKHTWRSYTEFLLSTLPRFQRVWFGKKFDHFWWWWRTYYGVGKNDAPDAGEPKLDAARKVPSWRRLARCILTNDVIGKSLSYAQTKGQWARYEAMRQEYGE
jgi:predicted phosphoadenosine phosphosulfate sulfurtransferase